MDNLLVLENVHKSFGHLTILRGVNLSLQPGQSVAILGPSGSGKSTLLHVAGLMEKPTSGKIILNGLESVQLSENGLADRRLTTIGFLFQFHYLLPDFDVLENVLMPVRLAGGNLKEGEKEARHILDRLGLSHRLRHRPHQLSGGEQQRTALARAIINHPRILLCDEPTGNLDAKTAGEMIELLWEESARQKLATIIVTHNEELARRVDISYHLDDGKLKKNEVK